MNYVVLDRDGTLVRHIPYLSRPEQVELLPMVATGLATLVNSGFKLFLHTNQSGIGRGYFSLADTVACNEEMLKQIGLGLNLFEAICICPELPEQTSLYRKPSPKFGNEIIQQHQINKDCLYYVGDNVCDLMTAVNVGCKGVGVNTGLHDLRQLLKEQAIAELYPVFDSFQDAITYIINDTRCLNESN